MIYNAEKLDGELRAAGLVFDGVDSNAEISWGLVEPTDAQLATAATVIAAHDPSPTLPQRLAAQGLSLTQWAFAQVGLLGQKAPTEALAEVSRVNAAIQ